MALTENKFIIPAVGVPIEGKIPVTSSTVGPDDVLRRALAGWADYDHNGGIQTNIPANEWTVLENNAAGNTITNFLPTGVTGLWVPGSGNHRFNLTSLAVGDMVDLRVDMEVTTSGPNVGVQLRLNFGGLFDLLFCNREIRTASTCRNTSYIGFYVGETIRNNTGIRLEVRTTAITNVKVYGWYVKVTRRGLV